MPQARCAENGTETLSKPNVLFIAVDDLRPAMGCYGDPLAMTPNMDRLAKRSVQFNRAYCQVAVCNPSRASLMTGLTPDHLGVWTLPIHFREAKPDAVTIPQWFRRFGYTAVSHGKIFHNPTPDPQSWSEPIRSLPRLPYPYPKGTADVVRAAMDNLPKNDWRKNNLRSYSTAAPNLPDDKVLDGARTNMAIDDLQRLSKEDRPFFLAMGYIRPHLAWVAPKKYWDMHDPDKFQVPTDQSVRANTPPYAPHNNSELSHYVDLIDIPKPWDDQPLPDEKIRHLLHGYYACVSYVDAQIGRLLDALDQQGVADNTIIVLWSDHGWKLGENRGWGKMTNYEIDARVPLLVSAPGLGSGGKQSDQLAELLDLYPTLCELAGIDTPAFVDGKSLVPLLHDTDATIREQAMSQYYRRHDGKEYMGYSMRTPEYRLIQWRDFSTGSITANELYDHSSDTEEQINVFDQVDPQVRDQLIEQLLALHPPKKLVMTPAVHSNPNRGRWRSELKFDNETKGDVMIYAITPDGRRGRKRKIEAGKEITISARIGGVYVVESADGKIHEIHSPAFPTKPVIIKNGS